MLPHCSLLLRLAALAAILLPCHYAASQPLPAQVRAPATRTATAPAGPYPAHDWLQRFYAPRAYTPAWRGASSALAAEALAVLAEADQHGLQAADYAVQAQPQDAARFDSALTLALLRYLSDLHSGRVGASLFGSGPARPGGFDPVAALSAALSAHDLRAAVRAAEPSLPIYQRLKASLAQYRALALRPRMKLPAPGAASIVEAGAPYEGVQALRAQLLALGDLAPQDAEAGDGRYSGPLVAAVARFQDRHGLLADGRLGPHTLAALNVPPEQRVRQIALSLERLRWLPDFPAGPFIVVNLPSFRLWAYRAAGADARPALAMRVIVGSAALHQTPLFIGQMRYLEFNPYWNVPDSIMRAELLPALATDADYLARHDMELVDRQGRPALAEGPAAAAALRAGALRVRQRPGPQNALGAVKFALPNAMGIYLHSTPSRQLFKRARRDFSHGCIRVEDPSALAAFVLAGQPEWTAAALAGAMSPGATRTVQLRSPLPVLIFYATALADHAGRTLFTDDVYRLDEQLTRALAAHSEAARAQLAPLR